jgi:hypothetical protein
MGVWPEKEGSLGVLVFLGEVTAKGVIHGASVDITSNAMF